VAQLVFASRGGASGEAAEGGFYGLQASGQRLLLCSYDGRAPLGAAATAYGGPAGRRLLSCCGRVPAGYAAAGERD
jgi:hypothetical protein